MKKAVVLAVMAALVFASGCTRQAPSAAGVVIESFTPDLNTAYPEDTVTFLVKIRNTGSVTAKEVELNLLNINDWQNCDSGCSFESLLPPDPHAGTQGESKICRFKCTAPSPPEGMTLTYHPIARLSYKYYSSVVKKIPLITREELVRITNAGESIPMQSESSTSGPIHLSIKGKGPARISNSQVNFPIEIEVTNTGSGRAETEKKADSVELNIDAGDMQLINCDERETLYLWKGKSSTLACRLSADMDKNNILTEKTIRVRAYYTYITDASSSITVRHS